MTTPKLLPCPWCGYEPEVLKTPNESSGPPWIVVCPQVDCGIIEFNGASKADAIRRWNTRKEGKK
jgi:hypothetical protein